MWDHLIFILINPSAICYTFPKNPGELEANADQWRDVPEIAGSLEEYRRAKEERERLYVSSWRSQTENFRRQSRR